MLRIDSPSAAESLQLGHVATDPTDAAVASEHGDRFDFGHLLDHMKNSMDLEFPGGHLELPHIAPVTLGGVTFDFSISKHVFFLLFSALLLLAMAGYAARKNRQHRVPK